jgi:hypothetical protein
MLTFHINRGGRNLPPSRRRVLESAKNELPIGARQQLAWSLADVYEYRVDMSRDLQAGDEFKVVAEPFSQWVIEDDFAGDRPLWVAAIGGLFAFVPPLLSPVRSLERIPEAAEEAAVSASPAEQVFDALEAEDHGVIQAGHVPQA